MSKFFVSLMLAVSLMLFGCSNNPTPGNQAQDTFEEELRAEKEQLLVDSGLAYENGLRSYHDKNYLEAIQFFGEVIAEDKNYKNAQSGLELAKVERSKEILLEGKGMFKTGDYSGAITKFDEAITLNSKLPEAVSLKQKAQIQYEAQLKKIEAQKAKAERQAIKEKMNTYEGDGEVGLAVGGIKLKRSTEYHVANGNGTFVYLFVSVKNFGSDIIHANPNDFTLSTPDGETVSHDSDTYSLNSYFDAVDLRPGNSTSGWLIFYSTKSEKYTLNYQGYSGTASKTLVP